LFCCFFSIIKILHLEVVCMKKYVAAAALIGAIGLSTIAMAHGRGNYGYGPGPGFGDCDGGRYCNNLALSEKDSEKASAFFAETKEIRKEIVVKRSELEALMQQDNPDEKKVAKLTGDLFDLQTMMEEKAEKTFEGTSRSGYGPGPGFGNCGRRGGW
jgi:zinc resistance-associated protein